MWPGPDAIMATERMLDMCKERKIPVMFLTIPMYHEHVTNAVLWHEHLKILIGDNPWLDLQLPAYDSYFDPECFEDAYKENQHQTSLGSIKSSILLSHFILKLVGLE